YGGVRGTVTRGHGYGYSWEWGEIFTVDFRTDLSDTDSTLRRKFISQVLRFIGICFYFGLSGVFDAISADLVYAFRRQRVLYGVTGTLDGSHLDVSPYCKLFR
ncbi:hypothetical protein U1Q18_051077, partial [Sarracenia purpurea var. burkii]